MIDFLFKSSISLVALLLFYHLILEREKMHQFNRFYLLFGLVFSFAIPFITIEIIEETVAPTQQTYTYVAQESPKMVVIKETIDYTPIILWSLYGLVTSILLFRYIRNILKIVSTIKSNPIVEYKNAKLVLLEEQTPPHTFLNYIFLNKAEYQNRKIEDELYTHELIHVTQKHTLDVLLVETLKTVFWFNPLFYFYKKTIQLNHEFIADEKVVNVYDNVPFYQNLLLAHTNKTFIFGLTSNLNYSVTKKRFIMMTKTVSTTRILLSKIALVPLFSGLIYFMCFESVAQVKTPTNTKENNLQISENNNKSNSGWTVSAVKNENLPSKENNLQIPENTNKPNSDRTVSAIKNENLPSKENNLQISENTNKPNSDWAVSVVKNENPPSKEPDFNVSFQFDLKGTKINDKALLSSLYKLSNHIVNKYESPKGVDKKNEIVIMRFLLKRDGDLADVKSYDNRGTEPETKLISILKSSPKSIFDNNYSDEVLIQMVFKPKGIEEIIAKEQGIPGKVAVGFPVLN